MGPAWCECWEHGEMFQLLMQLKAQVCAHANREESLGAPNWAKQEHAIIKTKIDDLAKTMLLHFQHEQMST